MGKSFRKKGTGKTAICTQVSPCTRSHTAKTPSAGQDQPPVLWEQQPAVPWSRNLSSIPSPVVICQAASPGCSQGQGQCSLCAQLQIQRKGQKREVKLSRGSTTSPSSSSWPCWDLPEICDRWWHPAAQPLSLCGSQIPLRVPSPSRNFLYFSKFIFQPDQPRCSAGWHRGTQKLQALSPAQHSCWTPLSRPLTTGSVSLFDEAHEKPPRA